MSGHDQRALRGGDGLYWPVAGSRLVDGVFVPDGRTGPVQLDSAGHTSEAFAGLSGATFGLIWARAAEVKPEHYTKGWHYAVGECRQFMPEGRGLLGLHANTGITFSLDAMRRMYSGVRPARFRATAGVADRLAAVATKPSEPGQADLWVFVDGQLKFKQTQRHPHAGTFNVDIELGAGDRLPDVGHDRRRRPDRRRRDASRRPCTGHGSGLAAGNQPAATRRNGL